MKYKKVYVIATENCVDGQTYTCYQGRDTKEARATVATLRREDALSGDQGRYSYVIKVETKDGNIERYLR